MIDLKNTSLILYKDENKFDLYITELLSGYNDDHKTQVSLPQIKGLVAVETQFNTTEKEISKITERFFKLYKKYNYKGLQRVYASFKNGGKIERKNGVLINQGYVDKVFAHTDFYYYRDIQEDYERASTIRKRIENIKYREWAKEYLPVIAIISAILLVIGLLLYSRKRK